MGVSESATSARLRPTSFSILSASTPCWRRSLTTLRASLASILWALDIDDAVAGRLSAKVRDLSPVVNAEAATELYRRAPDCRQERQRTWLLRLPSRAELQRPTTSERSAWYCKYTQSSCASGTT